MRRSGVRGDEPAVSLLTVQGAQTLLLAVFAGMRPVALPPGRIALADAPLPQPQVEDPRSENREPRVTTLRRLSIVPPPNRAWRTQWERFMNKHRWPEPERIAPAIPPHRSPRRFDRCYSGGWYGRAGASGASVSGMHGGSATGAIGERAGSVAACPRSAAAISACGDGAAAATVTCGAGAGAGCAGADGPGATAAPGWVALAKRSVTGADGSTGSGGGLKLFCAGIGVKHPDITNSSRRIKASEVEQCAGNGVTVVE